MRDAAGAACCRRLSVTPDDVVVVLSVPIVVPAADVVAAAGMDSELLLRRGVVQRRIAVLANPPRYCKAAPRRDEEAEAVELLRQRLVEALGLVALRRAAAAGAAPTGVIHRRDDGERGREEENVGSSGGTTESRGEKESRGAMGVPTSRGTTGKIPDCWLHRGASWIWLRESGAPLPRLDRIASADLPRPPRLARPRPISGRIGVPGDRGGGGTGFLVVACGESRLPRLAEEMCEKGSDGA
ncbi:hypothetical protein ZWY2020_035072 [Hordeum vulgare]|nr:hypothetical protein ZWY2020_035072 [Hordeum vulgare]